MLVWSGTAAGYGTSLSSWTLLAILLCSCRDWPANAVAEPMQQNGDSSIDCADCAAADVPPCRSYVLLVCFSTLACSLVVLLSFIWQQAANTALLLVSPFALAGAPLVSLGFMGCNQELSEVGDAGVIRQLDHCWVWLHAFRQPAVTACCMGQVSDIWKCTDKLICMASFK